MKIKKMELSANGQEIIVWMKEHPNHGFHFKIDNIVDDEWLKKQIRLKVKEVEEIEASFKKDDKRFRELKSLEGQEI